MVDRTHHPPHDAAARPLMGAQQHAAERRRERERIDCGEKHCHCDCYRELPEQFAGNARYERNRHKHRKQHQCDRNDRCGDFRHCTLGRFGRRKLRVLFHHPFDVFDDDDGIVDNNADGQHDGQQGNGIGRITNGQERNKCADEADGYGQGWNERGAHIAEENEDNDHDKNEGFNERLLYLVYGVLNEDRRIVGNLPCQIVGEVFLQLLNAPTNRIQSVNGVGARRLINRDRGGGAPIEPGLAVEVCRTQVNSRHPEAAAPSRPDWCEGRCFRNPEPC